MVNNYHQKQKERLRKKSHKRYQNLSEKKKRHQYYLERKKKLPDYRRNYHLTHKK